MIKLHKALIPAVLILCAVAGVAQSGGEEPPVSAPLPAIKLDPAAKAIVAASNAFTVDLFRRAAMPGENAVLSPASVSIAVGFAYRGARDETANQLRSVLHYPFEPAEYLRAGKLVLDSLEFTTPSRELHAANAIWTQSGMPFDQAYEADLAAFAKAGLNRVDFKGDKEKARAEINGWVANITRGKIPELLKPPHITADTRAALVNAIYFKGQWAHPFAKEATKPLPFAKLGGRKADVPMMQARWNYRVTQRKGAKLIDLPYEGGELSFIAIMPDDPAGLPAFEQSLVPAVLTDWLGALDAAEYRDTILSLPRFSIKAGAELSGTIAGMGAPLAFSDEANFSGMARLPYPGGNPKEVGLKIGPIVHAATLDVDENGSEAAAATAVVMDIIVSGLRNAPPPPPPFVFKADKPFLFVLRDNRTGLILFIGRYVGPADGDA
jgi:serpin B